MIFPYAACLISQNQLVKLGDYLVCAHSMPTIEIGYILVENDLASLSGKLRMNGRDGTEIARTRKKSECYPNVQIVKKIQFSKFEDSSRLPFKNPSLDS